MAEKCKCNTLKLDTFKKAELEDLSTFKNIIDKGNNIISAYDFVNLYLWQGEHQAKWKLYDDRIIIYYGDEDALLFPASKDNSISIEEAAEISDMMIDNGSRGDFIYVDYDNFVKDKEEEWEKYFDIEIDRDNSDYIYSVDKMCELGGKKLKKKRNLISQFIKNNPHYETGKISKDCFEGCYTLAEKWAAYKSSENNSNFSSDIKQLKTALDNFDKLELDGMCLRLYDEVVGFSLFNPKNSETIMYHFEKYAPNIKGSGQTITRETSKHFKELGYKYINREQDLGISGLRKAKESYDPLYKKLVCKLHRK
ncbi:MAG: phosphatidylglycerol lysyltransferase domain-containing protein [Spirochaetota bacterium]